MIEFKATKKELDLIVQCAARMENLQRWYGTPPKERYARTDLILDLEVCHSNGCPLDFQRLLDSPTFDFQHDVFGIYYHLDRATGELSHCFLPRCAK